MPSLQVYVAEEAQKGFLEFHHYSATLLSVLATVHRRDIGNVLKNPMGSLQGTKARPEVEVYVASRNIDNSCNHDQELFLFCILLGILFN